MAPLSDPATIASFREALSEWSFDEFVVWKPVPRDWVAKHLQTYSQKAIARLMHEHLESGGKIDQVAETREIYRDRYRFHFDFRLMIGGRHIYIETVLDQTPTGPVVTIVSMHDV